MSEGEVNKIETLQRWLKDEATGQHVRMTIVAPVTGVGSEYVYVDGKPVHILDIEAVHVLRKSEYRLIRDGDWTGVYEIR